MSRNRDSNWPCLRSNPFDEDAAERWVAATDLAVSDVWDEWLKARRRASAKRGVQRWSVVPKDKLFRVWKQYARDGFVRDEDALEDIAAKIVENAAKLWANTALMGHTERSAHDVLEVAIDASEVSKDEVERLLDGFEDFVVAENGQWRLSDRIDKVTNAAVDILAAETSADKIVAVDVLLSIAHQRSDLAASFVEGGSYALSELSETPAKATNPSPRLIRRAERIIRKLEAVR